MKGKSKKAELDDFACLTDPKEMEKIKKLVNNQVKNNFSLNPKFAELIKTRHDDIWNIMNIVIHMRNSFKSCSNDVVKSWIQSSVRELNRSLRAFENSDYEDSIRHLQQATENGIKSYAMYFGILGEDELKKILHNPVKLYILLLEKPWVLDAAKCFGIKTDIKSSLNNLKNLSTINDNNRKIILEMDKDIPIFLKLCRDIKQKVGLALSDAQMKKLIEKVNPASEMISFFEIWIDFAAFLLPIGVLTSVFQQATRYPDEFRKLEIEYSNLNLIKELVSIIDLMNNNFVLLEKIVQRRDSF
jgi:HEPN domain-containing protein